MKKVYCKNCRYDDGIYFNKQGCGLKLVDAVSGRLIQRGKSWWHRVDLANKLNTENNCSHYKRKWWKFWTKESKRKILKGAQPKTDAGPKPNTISEDDKIFKIRQLTEFYGNKSKIIVLTNKEYKELCKYLEKIRS